MPAWNKFTEKHLSNIFRRLKERRVILFVKKLNLGSEDTILDLGSEDGAYLAQFYPYPSRITLADINESAMKKGVKKFGLGGYQLITEEGTLPFQDKQFSAVWCNSVIEHVTVKKDQLNIKNSEFIEESHRHQNNFANEIKRVAQKYFVQTPYVHYPIESHSWMPFIPYLTQRQRCFIARVFKAFWIKQWSADFYLYNRSRFESAFIDADEFFLEKTLGVTKSMIAIRTKI